ncbi:uncharacterized protein F5891DRAFT_1185654 [Suillus fuscotomentosus]|uniref:Uncharacterized protein n=1 Tax=Suillus fuscotomentosus TaxID=1912939 RepID=A0AAD4EBA7_9AGAM|nr:uncharacterized protein F5891DRAFT_1185654 [Suillus fuscotomentosus]KAG1903006.1 hypothetical protein F5891DRAFT_1185654 [Suillus fuscotomentosus]
MVKNHKWLAAACAARWKNKPLVSACSSVQALSPPSAQSAGIPKALSTEFSPIDLDFDNLSDCGYTGGIDFHQLNDEHESDSPSGNEWSDDESLCELEGNDLEENLKGLQAETFFDKLSWPKTSMWCAPKASAMTQSGMSDGAQSEGSSNTTTQNFQLQPGTIAIDFAGYLSDESDLNSKDDSDSELGEDAWPPDSGYQCVVAKSSQSTHKCLPAVPPLKH